MPEAVYRVVTLLCAVVKTVPIGTNLGLVEVLWMLVSGRLLAIPLPLSPRATRDMYKDRWPVEQLHVRFVSARPSR